jgi:hypothetical protein
VIAACVLKENEIKMVGILKPELPPHVDELNKMTVLLQMVAIV